MNDELFELIASTFFQFQDAGIGTQQLKGIGIAKAQMDAIAVGFFNQGLYEQAKQMRELAIKITTDATASIKPSENTIDGIWKQLREIIIATNLSECMDACEFVCKTFEGDGMENMGEREKVIYQNCKAAVEGANKFLGR